MPKLNRFEIKSFVDQAESETDQHLNEARSNKALKIEVSEQELLNKESQKLLDDCVTFSENFIQGYKLRLNEIINKYRHEAGKNTPQVDKIISFLKEKDLLAPRMKIFGPKESFRFLKEMGQHYIIDEDSLLLVFNHPKPLAHFWTKGNAGLKQYDKSIDLQKNVMEWGTFYRQIMEFVWEQADSHPKSTNLNFSRVNPMSDHEPTEYYYIWEVYRGKK